MFVDLFKPLLQKTFVEGIVETLLRDQHWILFLSLPLLKARSRGGKGSGQKEISSHHNASAAAKIYPPKPYNLHSTFLSTKQKYSFEKADWKSTIKPLGPPWIHTKFDVIENRLVQGDNSFLAMDSRCLKTEQIQHCLYFAGKMKFGVNRQKGGKSPYTTVDKTRIFDAIANQICFFLTHWIEIKLESTLIVHHLPAILSFQWA